MNNKLAQLLAKGSPLLRRELHQSVGGQTQSGISPSAKEALIMLFSDPISGPQHGYIDGWQADGFYHYTGEGQRGDQVMTRGNKAIGDHKADGRELHLFQATGKGQPIDYVGEFAYFDRYDADAPETGGGPMRRVLIFRLKPIGSVRRTIVGPVEKAESDLVTEVAVESSNTEKAVVEPSREPYEAERKEAKLIADFIAWSHLAGRQFKRLKIIPKGEGKPLFSDLYSKKARQLIEAKGSISQDAIRMAIGQLYDYRRFAEAGTDLAVLLPERPRPDLVELIHFSGVAVVYRTEGGFDTFVRQNDVETVAVIPSLRLVNAAVEPLERLRGRRLLEWNRGSDQKCDDNKTRARKPSVVEAKYRSAQTRLLRRVIETSARQRPMAKANRGHVRFYNSPVRSVLLCWRLGKLGQALSCTSRGPTPTICHLHFELRRASIGYLKSAPLQFPLDGMAALRVARVSSIHDDARCFMLRQRAPASLGLESRCARSTGDATDIKGTRSSFISRVYQPSW